jgi:uncharacterized protein YggE
MSENTHFDIGIITQAETLPNAETENLQRLDAVLVELRQKLDSGMEIKAISHSINPSYRYPNEDSTRKITGYTVINIIQVTINDLTWAGRVTDAAT